MEIIKILLDKGICVDLTITYVHTLLHVSAKCGNLEATKTLVGRGAAFNNPDENGGNSQFRRHLKAQ